MKISNTVKTFSYINNETSPMKKKKIFDRHRINFFYVDWQTNNGKTFKNKYFKVLMKIIVYSDEHV